MRMELVLCMSRLKPRNLSMLRGFYQTQHPSSKTLDRKEENDYVAAKNSLQTWWLPDPFVRRSSRPRARTIADLSNRSGCFYQIDRSTTLAFGRICLLCQ